ncbi:MAG: ribonuclease D [Acidobacteriota bacterium]
MQSPLPRPAEVRHDEWIADDAHLERVCRRWLEAPALALDTEFVRERTFYPRLGLLQINDGERISLVDPLAIDDLSPLAAVLEETKVIKILHSCSEDLEVFDVHLDTLPTPLFDTQVAATLLYDANPPGYARLIDELFGIEVPKGETRSNWMRRPLRESQLHYAALDVAYLLPAAERLRDTLTERRRDRWLKEEMNTLLESARNSTPDDELYLSIGRARLMNPRQLEALKELYAWRQREARKRDLPRSFIVKDRALNSIAQLLPRSFDKLGDIEDLDRRTRERHGKALMRIVKEARQCPAEELPRRMKRPADLSLHKETVNRLRSTVKERAAALEIAPEVLANRRTVERVMRRHLDGADPTLPPTLSDGWRFEAVGQALLAAI